MPTGIVLAQDTVQDETQSQQVSKRVAPSRPSTWAKKRTTQAQRSDAARRAKISFDAMKKKRVNSSAVTAYGQFCDDAIAAANTPGGSCAQVSKPGGIPDTFGPYSNWANSPRLKKFIDKLPGLTAAGANGLGQYIPVAVPDTTTYPGSDYYELSLVEFSEKMHTGTYLTAGGVETTIPGGVTPKLRGYVQTNKTPQELPHYLGPLIIARKDRPVRVKFTNNLATGAAGKLMLPVDVSVMGSGPGPTKWTGAEKAENLCTSKASDPTPLGCFTENRATLHLHGGRTPWISDGTPHQWITPATEQQPRKGLSLSNVPDMPDPGDGSQTFYWTNQQSARLMFYHDHASGITRLNVYAGEAAGYLLRDDMEDELIASGVIPNDNFQIPLIIQDKTFVNTEPLLGPAGVVPAVHATDPTWNWGSNAPDPVTGIRTPRMGDLWWPHVYVTAQNPYDISGVNPWGRWAYGPWFWPPTGEVLWGEVFNELYDPLCDPDLVPGGYCQPYKRAGTPNISWGAEAFLDTPVINGTAFPYLEVQPQPYRFRILNAAHDRFWNLQLYQAGTTDPITNLPVYVQGGTEVAMVNAFPGSVGFPPLTATDPRIWPTDGREGGVPAPSLVGPDWIQIGTESGILPKPVVVPTNPVVWNNDPTTFNAGNVSKGSLILGPAERADVVVDFSAFAGKTLILYNDAPAAFPARDPRLDYYTGAPDLGDTGGFTVGNPAVSPIVPGYGPNTRTLMQIRVAAGSGTAFNMTALNNKWVPNTTSEKSVFQRSQEPIIVGQKFYNAPATDLNRAVYKVGATPVRFPSIYPNWGISRIQDNTLSFQPAPTATAAALPPIISALPMQPKAIHDEMGAAFDEYGRMSAKLGLERSVTTALTQNFIIQNYVDPTTELVRPSDEGSVTAGDGTQVWKITHNGVDTHPVHFHIFDVQLINRVGWDGIMRVPDENELGWKDTVRISPLEDTIVAVRPVAPRNPFGIPNSERPLNPAIPVGIASGTFSNINPVTQLAVTTINNLTNFGWEYVWHCHILSHEEADMMRPIVVDMTDVANTGNPVFNTLTQVPDAPTALSRSGSSYPVILTWGDPTIPPAPNADLYKTTTRSLLGNPKNEIWFEVFRSSNNGVTWTSIGKALANQTTFTDTGASSSTAYQYQVKAYNAKGYSAASNTVTVSPVVGPAPDPPTNFTATYVAPNVNLSWTAGANATGYLLQRATDNAFTANLVTLPTPVGTSAVDTPAAGVYWYRVYSTNAAGQGGPAIASVTAGTALPAPNLFSSTLSANPTRVVLNWTNVAGETGYTITRTASPGGAVIQYPLAANVITYTNNSDLTPGSSYSYTVTATGAVNSPPSNTRTVGPPTPLTNVACASVVGGGVTVTWSDNSATTATGSNESAFMIQKYFNNVLQPAMANINPANGTGARTFTDNAATAAGSYRYEMKAINPLSVVATTPWVSSVACVK